MGYFVCLWFTKYTYDHSILSLVNVDISWVYIMPYETLEPYVGLQQEHLI